jgi:hypothetical protein
MCECSSLVASDNPRCSAAENIEDHMTRALQPYLKISKFIIFLL